MAYSQQQRRIIGLARNLSRGAPPIARRALFEALSVESGFRPLPYGDRDSVGVLQQRPSQGWGPASETPAQDIHQFLSRAVPIAGRYQTAGQLAQAVQRSAFPGRYDQRRSQAIALLQGAGGASPPGPPGPVVSLPAGAPARADDGLLRQLAGVVGVPYTLPPSAGPASTPVPARLKVQYTTGAKATPRARNVVQLAHEYLGTPYVWGGEKPGGFDCSGLVQYLYGQQGVHVPRTTYDQFKAGTPVARAQLQPGDVVFFHAGPNGPEHEGLFIGGGQFIQAPRTGDVVKISSLNSAYYRQAYVGARRFG